METRSYEQIMEICFTCKGKNFDGRDSKCIERVNSFLRKFRRMIEEIKIEKGDFKAWVGRVDEFNYELLDTSTIICSHQIKWSCVDGPGWGQRLNQHVRPWLHDELRKLYLWNEQKYNDKLEIQVVDTVFQGSPKRGLWPAEKPMVISF